MAIYFPVCQGVLHVTLPILPALSPEHSQYTNLHPKLVISTQCFYLHQRFRYSQSSFPWTEIIFQKYFFDDTLKNLHVVEIFPVGIWAHHDNSAEQK